MDFLFRIYTKVPVGFESLFHLDDNHAPVYAKYFGAKARGNSTCGGTMSITRFTIFLCICTVTFTPEMPSLLPNFYPTPPYVYTVTEYAISRAWRRLRGRNRRFL